MTERTLNGKSLVHERTDVNVRNSLSASSSLSFLRDSAIVLNCGTNLRYPVVRRNIFRSCRLRSREVLHLQDQYAGFANQVYNPDISNYFYPSLVLVKYFLFYFIQKTYIVKNA